MNSVYIEITDVCNLHCSFCPCGVATGAERRTFMPSGLFEKCIEGAEQVGAQNVYFHVLGEPTFHPGFAHYVKKLEHTKLKLNLTTNGTTVTRCGHHILQSPAVRQVNFSTHAYAELPQAEATGHLQNVLDFCRIALMARPDLYINLRLWNVGDDMASAWNRYMLEQVNKAFGTQVEPGHFCSRHKSFEVTGRLYLHEDSRFEWPVAPASGTVQSGVSARGTCLALDTHCGILHDGRVVACCLDHGGQILLGRIQEQSLLEILESPLAANLREGFQKHELRHPLCKTCSFCKRFK